MSYPLGVPVESNANSSAHPEPNSKVPLKGNGTSGLTRKQLLKQDAMLWAEFLYSEYKREKALREGAQTKPTHYDNPDA